MAENRNPIHLREQRVSPKPVRMVCLDLDGTLFNRKKEVGQLSRRQIQRCLDQEIEVAVVSGRAFQFVYKTAQLIDPRVAVIGFVGAYRHFRGQSEGEAIPQGALMMMLKRLKAENCCTFMKQLNTIWCSHADQLTTDYVAYTADLPAEHRLSYYPNQDLEAVAAQTQKPVYKLLIRAQGKTEQIADQLRHVEGVRLFVYPYGDIEVISAKADKGRAIRQAAKQLGMDPARILGIGDSINDLPMFEGCGLRVAMANAADQVKAQADYITLSNEEDGVGEALRRLVL